MTKFGELLRHWRKSRHCSQLDLGLAADVSAKHISFLETGRSQPSREMVIALAVTLDIPLNERNVLLYSAGFSEEYSRMPLDEPEMLAVRKALDYMLFNHEPYPAAVLDWEWNMVMANRAHQGLVHQMAAQQSQFPRTHNVMQLLFDPNGLRPFVENWEDIACLLLQRLQRERMVFQDRSSTLLELLLDYPGIPPNWRQFDCTKPAHPMIEVVMVLNGQRLRLFSSLASFGTPIDVTAQELIVEQYFPADESTRKFFDSRHQLTGNRVVNSP